MLTVKINGDQSMHQTNDGSQESYRTSKHHRGDLSLQGFYIVGATTKPLPVWKFGGGLAHRKLLKFDVKICRFWCILTAVKSLVPADD